MKIHKVSPTNIHIYFNLLQAYEAEFSPLTEKDPDENGLFSADTPIDETHHGYLCNLNGRPAGLANIKVDVDEKFEVCEFYIVPRHRQSGLGTNFIHELWRMLEGDWTIKQIVGADHASRFWQQAIGSFGSTYIEEIIHDPYWGKVTQQKFSLGLGLTRQIQERT